MPARFVPLSKGSAPIIPVQRPVVLIGRHPDCDIRIDLPQISRRHCCVALAYDRLTIRDLGSKNGVRVNGKVVEEVQLRPGDEVAIAHLIYRLEDDSPAPTPRPPAESEPDDLPALPAEIDDDSDDDLVPLDI